MDWKKSEQCFRAAGEILPGGVNSPVRAFRAVGRTPFFAEHGKGSRIWDVDGNGYIDYVCSWGPGILGHARAEVVAAVQEAAAKGLTFGVPTAAETELAETIREAIPSMEMMRMVSSGTEAVMSAVRAARGFTGREKIVKFTGCYHGHSDGLLVKAGSGLLTGAIPDSAGVPKGYAENTLLARYNDVESVRALFAANPGEIACVVVEPVAANMGVVLPEEDFLPSLRKITEENGALLIFDEVITGFRVSYGGAQEYYGVTPDLTTLGKIVGGGMPLAVYGGRREIMENIAPLGAVYQAGTLSGNPAAVAAGIATLKILRDTPSIYAEMEQKAAEIERAMLEKGWTVNRVGSLLSAFFTGGCPVTDYESAKAADTRAYAAYFGHMLENGIYVAPSQFEAMFVSAAHSGADIEKTCAAVRAFEG